MKISLNWLKEYVDINSDPQELGSILTSLGLEVEGVEEVESIPGGLKGLVVGEVIECGRHPNADRLSVTQVDIGQENALNIVCGAPNVSKGQKVVVATVGTLLHPTNGEPFKIKKGKIRGEVSEGMICAEDEIGIGTDHDGIIVLPETSKIGIPAADVFNIEQDVVYDIGLTPNRSDATSHIGVAKDLLAYFRFHQNADLNLKYPYAIDTPAHSNHSDIKVNVLNKEKCPRFSGIVLKDLKIGPSPEWMQNRLNSIGVRPINNVVDITNYVLHEYGQPLHAYDLEKIRGGAINVMTLDEGATFTTLDEKERKLSHEDLMICDGEKQGMCIAGVFGGIHSGVTDGTNSIFLEAAHFEANSVRKTSTRHLLRTDAAKCFEKGTDPKVTVQALLRASSLLVDFADANVASDLIDIYPKTIEPAIIDVDRARVNELIGIEIDPEQLRKILNALEIQILEETATHLKVQIPTDKADVTREIDVIEEILRIYGFDNVPLSGRMNYSMNSGQQDSIISIRERLSNFLVSRGYFEMKGLSLVPSKLYEGIGALQDELVYINNTSNIHLDAMRPEMMLPALLSVAHNINRQQTTLSYFENGRAYANTKEGEYAETEWFVVLKTGQKNQETWRDEQRNIDFYDVKQTVAAILDRFGIHSYQTSELEDSRFSYGLCIHRGSQILANFGKVASMMTDKADVNQEVFYAEINAVNLVKANAKSQIKFQEIPKFPSSRRDLALIVEEHVTYDEIKRQIIKSTGSLLRTTYLFDIYRDKKHLGEGKKSYAVAMIFEDKEKNLKDKVIDKLVAKTISNLTSAVGATLR